eukprot:334636_1
MSIQTETQYVALDDKIDQNDTYISLFPCLDRLILYTPTYILKNRNHIIHCAILTSIWLAVLFTLGYTLWFFASSSTYGLDAETFGFLILMFILPFFASALRLYFFIYHFDFSIWHQPRESITNPSKYASKLSFILKQEPYFLARMSKRFNIGCYIIFGILFVIILLRFVINIQLIVPNLFHQNEKQININYKNILIASGSLLAQQIGQQIPDCLMMLVGRLYFTESHLAILNYTKELKTMTPKQIILGNIHTKYDKMYQFINNISKPFKNYILCFIITFCFLCWYLLTVFSTVADKVFKSKDVTLAYQYLLIAYAVYNVVLGIFTLWPAFRMTELSDELTDVVNDKITNILENRIHFYHDDILNPFMESLQYKQVSNYSKNNSRSSKVKKELDTLDMEITLRKNTLSLRSNLALWSEQKSALEILNQLVFTMEQQSCAYQVFGLSLDRYSMRNFIIGLAVGKIFALMWNSV